MKFAFNEDTIPAMIAGASAGTVLSSEIPASLSGPMTPVLCAVFMAVVSGALQSNRPASQVNETPPPSP